MLRIRSARDIDDFTGLSTDPADYADTVGALWASGSGRPEWCFVVEDETGRIARVGFRVSPTTTEPAWRGSLPAEELAAYGLELPWDQNPGPVGRALLAHALGEVGEVLPDVLELTINPELHPHAGKRVRWAAGMDLDLFQEKEGFEWRDDGRPIDGPTRLRFTTIEESGVDAYRSVMALCGAGTLDRNDRYYWEGCGPENWAAQMVAFCVEDDAPLWLLGYAQADPVGYVAVAREPEWGSTIVHIGVLPEHRGRGYVDDLLAGATAAARRAGIGSMLSDVDVQNTPMIHAMRRAGHLDGRRPWHRWIFRTPTDRLV